jgi:hypothetical protein
VASHTIAGQAWADGTTVGVYPAVAVPAGADAPSGQAVATGVVSGGSVTFNGLQEKIRYYAYALGVGKFFLISATLKEGDRARIEALEAEVGPASASRLDVLPTSYSGAGDGVTVEDAAFAAWLATLAGREGYVPRGTYKLNTAKTLPAGARLRLAPDAILDFSGAPVNATLISCVGTSAASVALTADAVEGATTLTVAAGGEAGIASGDYLRVSSTAQYDPGRTNTPIGEIVQVASTASGSIVLRSGLAGGPYNVADTAIVEELALADSPSIEGGKIRGGGVGLTHTGVKFDMALSPRCKWTEFEACEGNALTFVDCIDPQAWDVRVRDSSKSTSGYGISFGAACQDGRVIRGSARGCRHATTTVSPSGRRGIPRRIDFEGMTCWDTVSTGDGFDTHAASEHITYRNCDVYDSAGVGINLECAMARVVGCKVWRTASHGIYFHNETGAPTNIEIDRNEVLFAGDMGVRVTNGTVTGAGATQRRVKVTDNYIRSSTGRAVYVVSTATWRFLAPIVRGNRSENCLDASAVFQVQKVTGGEVSHNHATGGGASQSLVRLSDVIDASVVGNGGYQGTASTGSGINATSCLDLTITGNVYRDSSTGILLDNNCANCTVLGNNLRGCTTPISRGTGLGHILSTADNAGAYNRT